MRRARQIIFRTVKGADGLSAFQGVFPRTSHTRAMLPAWRENVLYFEGSKKKVHRTDEFLSKKGTGEFYVGPPAGCVVRSTVQRRPREDAGDPVFFNSVRGTRWKIAQDDEPRKPREQLFGIDVRLVRADLTREPSDMRGVYIRKSVGLARHGCTRGGIGYGET